MACATGFFFALQKEKKNETAYGEELFLLILFYSRHDAMPFSLLFSSTSTNRRRNRERGARKMKQLTLYYTCNLASATVAGKLIPTATRTLTAAEKTHTYSICIYFSNQKISDSELSLRFYLFIFLVFFASRDDDLVAVDLH